LSCQREKQRKRASVRGSICHSAKGSFMPLNLAAFKLPLRDTMSEMNVIEHANVTASLMQ